MEYGYGDMALDMGIWPRIWEYGAYMKYEIWIWDMEYGYGDMEYGYGYGSWDMDMVLDVSVWHASVHEFCFSAPGVDIEAERCTPRALASEAFG